MMAPGDDAEADHAVAAARQIAYICLAVVVLLVIIGVCFGLWIARQKKSADNEIAEAEKEKEVLAVAQQTPVQHVEPPLEAKSAKKKSGLFGSFVKFITGGDEQPAENEQADEREVSTRQHAPTPYYNPQYPQHGWVAGTPGPGGHGGHPGYMRESEIPPTAKQLHEEVQHLLKERYGSRFDPHHAPGAAYGGVEYGGYHPGEHEYGGYHPPEHEHGGYHPGEHEYGGYHPPEHEHGGFHPGEHIPPAAHHLVPGHHTTQEHHPTGHVPPGHHDTTDQHGVTSAKHSIQRPAD